MLLQISVDLPIMLILSSEKCYYLQYILGKKSKKHNPELRWPAPGCKRLKNVLIKSKISNNLKNETFTFLFFFYFFSCLISKKGISFC